MTYSFLLESVWHPPLAFADIGRSELPPEIALQALWFAGAFGRSFRTTDGRTVRIIQFGEWNRTAGPDFLHCAVELDGQTRTGAIELDLESACWENHGHRNDPAFRETILHVVFKADAAIKFIRTDEHREVPQILIPDTVMNDALNRPSREVALAHPGRCMVPLRTMPKSAVERLLEEAANHRAATKASRFLRVAEAQNRDEALFQATAETLGYRQNALAMRLLAQRNSLATLKALGNDAHAVLLGVAGFLAPDLHEKAPAETKEFLRDQWNRWWKLRGRFELAPDRTITWKTSGQRPANHPHRRVGALASLISNWPAYRRLAFAEPFAAKPIVEFLQHLDNRFWTHRHTLTSSASPRPISMVGRSRAIELLANHLAPLALREGRMTTASYHKMRNSQANDQVKRCAIRLFGSIQAASPWLKRTMHHQALLQVYHDFCLDDFTDCANCPFPEQLTQWR